MSGPRPTRSRMPRSTSFGNLGRSSGGTSSARWTRAASSGSRTGCTWLTALSAIRGSGRRWGSAPSGAASTRARGASTRSPTGRRAMLLRCALMRAARCRMTGTGVAFRSDCVPMDARAQCLHGRQQEQPQEGDAGWGQVGGSVAGEWIVAVLCAKVIDTKIQRRQCLAGVRTAPDFHSSGGDQCLISRSWIGSGGFATSASRARPDSRPRKRFCAQGSGRASFAPRELHGRRPARDRIHGRSTRESRPLSDDAGCPHPAHGGGRL